MMTKAQRAKSNFNTAHNNASRPYEIALADGWSALAEAVIELQVQQAQIQQLVASKLK